MANPPPARLASIILIGLVFALHGRVAVLRSSGLLEHDEAITLLAAAGKTADAEALYAALEAPIRATPAGHMQALLRPTGTTDVGDVLRSLARRDRHPPLYFAVLHWLQRLGIDSHATLRLLGSLVIVLAAWAAARWIFPDAAAWAKVLGLAWLTATPVMINVATELRQYALVYLGTILSLAAALLLSATRPASRRSAVMIAAFAPALLLWSQYGTIIWIAVVLGAAAVLQRRAAVPRWRTFGQAAAISGVLLLPLALWGMPGSAGLGPTPSVALTNIYPEVVEPVLRSVGQAWCSLPGRWFGSDIWPAVAGMLLLLTGALVWLRRCFVDRVLWVTAIGWGALWIALLALGRIPPHALTPKHLAPLVLCPAVILLRATAAQHPRWMRCAATAVIGASLLSHVLGDWQLLAGPKEQRPLLASLRSTQCLILSAPKRGYALPLTAQLRPDATVVIADPVKMAADWSRLEEMLPATQVVLAEIDPYPGSKAESALREIVARLSRCYRETVRPWHGRRRTITTFRHRRWIDQFEDITTRATVPHSERER